MSDYITWIFYGVQGKCPQSVPPWYVPDIEVKTKPYKLKESF